MAKKWTPVVVNPALGTLMPLPAGDENANAVLEPIVITGEGVVKYDDLFGSVTILEKSVVDDARARGYSRIHVSIDYDMSAGALAGASSPYFGPRSCYMLTTSGAFPGMKPQMVTPNGSKYSVEWYTGPAALVVTPVGDPMPFNAARHNLVEATISMSPNDTTQLLSDVYNEDHTLYNPTETREFQLWRQTPITLGDLQAGVAINVSDGAGGNPVTPGAGTVTGQTTIKYTVTIS